MGVKTRVRVLSLLGPQSRTETVNDRPTVIRSVILRGLEVQ